MKRFLLFALAGLMCATTATGSRAEPLAPPGINDNQWRFSLTPYIFLPADVSGDSTVAGQTVSIDFDTSELLDILDFAFATRAEAWKGNFAIILDGNYVDVGLDATTKGPGPFPGGEEVDVDVRQFYLDLLASYRVLKKPYNDDGDLWTLEVMGGGRYNYLKQVIDLKEEGSLGPGVNATLGGSETWVDPMVGARVMAMLSERWSMSVRGDIGGFGIHRHRFDLVAHGRRRLSPLGANLAQVRLAILLDRLCDDPQRWSLCLRYRRVRSVCCHHVHFPIASIGLTPVIGAQLAT